MDESASSSASDIPDEFKTPLARLYKALHGHGIGSPLFRQCLEEAGYSVSRSQLDRWVARLDTIGSVIVDDKETGAPSLLDREKRDIASGWVLHENETGNKVSLASFYSFVLDHFGIDLSYATISNYLYEDGFASRVVQKKAKSFVVDLDSMCKELWNWVYIQDFRARVIKRDELTSIDYMFTGHRTDRTYSFAPKGGPQPMVAEDISNFTNCVVTCVWADGKNRTPPKLFTYNPAFRTDRNPTKKRLEQLAHLHECLDKYGISEDRVIYIGESKNEMKKYARECPDLIRLFFEDSNVPAGCTVYSDEGNSFFDNGKSVLLEVGFRKHVCYPARVHQYLSVNDNPLHGTSKQSWRNCGVKFSDDVESCLALLSFLDRDIVNHSKDWWDRNLICLEEEGVRDLIGKGKMKRSNEHKLWKRSYENFIHEYNANKK